MVLEKTKKARAKKSKCSWCENYMRPNEIGMSHCNDCYKEIGGQS